MSKELENESARERVCSVEKELTVQKIGLAAGNIEEIHKETSVLLIRTLCEVLSKK